MSPGPFGARAPECPKSVPRVSPECQKGVPDTPGTLSGHLLDTPSDTPPLSGTLSGTLPGTLRARRARGTPVAGRGVRKPCSPRTENSVNLNFPSQMSLWTSPPFTSRCARDPRFPLEDTRAPHPKKTRKNAQKLQFDPTLVCLENCRKTTKKNYTFTNFCSFL